MGDAANLRAKRYRQHKQGDHSLCVAGRCEALGGPKKTGTATGVANLAVASHGSAMPPSEPAASPEVDANRIPGGIEAATIAFVASLPYRPPDPRALLAQIAVRLAQRIDETNALPAAVRELRLLLVQLAEVPNGPHGIVDEVRLTAAQRAIDSILAGMG